MVGEENGLGRVDRENNGEGGLVVLFMSTAVTCVQRGVLVLKPEV